MKINENKFLIGILLVSFISRLFIATSYVSVPDIPHDFYAYIAAGESLKKGTLYIDVIPQSGMPSEYGPMFALTMASWITAFGKSYVLLKIPGILFDIFIIYLIYQIVKRIKNIEAAKYASILYSFSYISLWSSGAEGNDDHMFLFFMLLSLFFLIKDNYILSAISLGISLGYKLTPIIMILPVLIYLYSTKKLRNAVIYLMVTVTTFSLILLPFYLKAELNVFFPYKTHGEIGGASILGFIKMLGYYFIFGVDKPYDTYQFPEWTLKPVSIAGFIFTIIYIFKFRLNDKRMELFRNIFIFIFTGLVFSSVFHSLYVLWLLPFIVLITTHSNKSLFNYNKFSLTNKELLGILLVIVGAILHGEFYRWLIDYSSMQRALILLGIVLASIGTYLSLIKTTLKKSWSLLMFGTIMGNVIHARVLLLFGSLIPSLNVQRLAWGYAGFATVAIMLAGMFWLFKEVHDTTLEK